MNSRLLSLIVISGVLAVCGCHKSVQTSGGMSPTIAAGEKVAFDYRAYATEKPRRWDVVVLTIPVPAFEGEFKVLKRIIALPLETISLTSSGIVVNGNPLQMPVALSNVVYCPPENLSAHAKTSLVPFPYTVPPGHYFVVGDNWANSLDSRHYGAVPATNILGRVRHK